METHTFFFCAVVYRCAFSLMPCRFVGCFWWLAGIRVWCIYLYIYFCSLILFVPLDNFAWKYTFFVCLFLYCLLFDRFDVISVDYFLRFLFYLFICDETHLNRQMRCRFSYVLSLSVLVTHNSREPKIVIWK